MDFKIKNGEKVRTVKAIKASATVIEAGDIVGDNNANGILVKATGTTAAIAFCPNGAAAGTTEIEVTVGNDFTLIGLNSADAVFAANMKGDLCDLKISGSDQIIDSDTSSTNVFQIGIGQDAGVVGSAKNIEVKINKPLF